MDKLLVLAISTLSLLCLAGLNACVPAIPLGPPELAKAPTQIGSVAVGNVNDLRPQDTGGQGFRVIGEVGTGLGGRLLQTEEGREIDTAIRETVKNALEHAGYYVLTPAIPGDVPRLDVDVMRFWGDGREDNQIEAMLEVNLVDTASGISLARREIRLTRDFAVSAGYGSLNRAFSDIMKDLQQELVSFVQSEPFRIAVRGK